MNKFNQLFFPHEGKKEYFGALDGLRGLAVLFVLLSHSSNDNLFFHEYLNFQKIGKIGVYLFFVLSAYLLDRQIALALMTGKSSKLYWKNYFLRRFLRIYPLFTISLLAYGFASFMGMETMIQSKEDFFSHLFLIKGEWMYWSIPVEFKYYFISPLIMFFCHKYLKWDIKYMLILLSIIMVLATALTLSKSFVTDSRVSTFRYFPIFLVGTIISIYELLIKQKHNLEKYKQKIEIAGGISLAIILITIPYYFQLIFDKTIPSQNAKFYVFFAVLWGLILITAKYGTGIIKRILEFKLLRFLGIISFSLYLFHQLILKLIISNYIVLPENIKIYIFFIFSIILSTITYLIIEKPLSKIKIYKQEITEKQLSETLEVK
ncbi:MAG: acyltransferase [Bacteroidetes bacterium]|nr:acyltransferase [Bacteroidota bacterium]